MKCPNVSTYLCPSLGKLMTHALHQCLISFLEQHKDLYIDVTSVLKGNVDMDIMIRVILIDSS